MSETLFKILQYVIYALIIVVARYIIPLIRTKLQGTKFEEVIKFIEKAINAAEKIYENIPKSGEEKKAYVIKVTTEYINKIGIKITEEQLNVLIEGIFVELDGVTINAK